MNELPNKLYKIANELVGKVGESTNIALSVTGEPYVTFALITKDMNEIEKVWTDWIKAYIFFRNNSTLGCEDMWHKKDLIIFWCTKPHFLEEDGKIQVYARILISRDDMGTVIPYDNF